MKLITMTWNDVQNEMSIAGEPEKARKFGEAVLELTGRYTDGNNIPSVENEIFALERVIAELKNWKKILAQRQHSQ